MYKLLPLFFLSILSCKTDTVSTPLNEGKQPSLKSAIEVPKITPVQHASFVMSWGEQSIYVDPTGGSEAFALLAEPTLILVTDIHGDHFNPQTLEQLHNEATIIAPEAVHSLMSDGLKARTQILNNNEVLSINGLQIKGIPMYNISEDRLNFHVKGRGNGYVVSKESYKVYISGDTEDIPEMRQLKEIDLALICMNLPYTMTPDAAADATLEFQPKKVMPYHYRGRKEGKAFYHDVDAFKAIVNTANADIDVELLDWYPNG